MVGAAVASRLLILRVKALVVVVVVVPRRRVDRVAWDLVCRREGQMVL